MSSGEFSGELDKGAEDLFAILSSQFERDFEPLGYHARLHFPINPDNAIFTDPLQNGFVALLTGKDLDPHRPWKVDVGFIPTEEKLGFTRLELPLHTPSQDESLALQRFPIGFLPLLLEGERERSIDLMQNDKPIRAAHISRLLASVGYGLPELFTSPDDLRASMAELADTATAWSAQETITIPEDPSSQITLTRTMSRRPNGTRDEMDMALSAIGEMVSNNGSTRQQLVVQFVGSDYSVSPPTVEYRELRLDEEILAAPGANDYKVVKLTSVTPTREALDDLTRLFVDSFAA